MNMSSDDTASKRPSLIVRGAERIGAALGRWQRRRASARDDAFVEKWKKAWAEGCEAFGAGASQEAVPYKRAPRREAWLAGWQWSQGRPADEASDRPAQSDQRSARVIVPAPRTSRAPHAESPADTRKSPGDLRPSGS